MSEQRVARDLEIVNPKQRPVGVFPALADSLRRRLVALSCEVENTDNQMVEVIEELVQTKKEALNQAKGMLQAEKQFLNEQLR